MVTKGHSPMRITDAVTSLRASATSVCDFAMSVRHECAAHS